MLLPHLHVFIHWWDLFKKLRWNLAFLPSDFSSKRRWSPRFFFTLNSTFPRFRFLLTAVDHITTATSTRKQRFRFSEFFPHYFRLFDFLRVAGKDSHPEDGKERELRLRYTNKKCSTHNRKKNSLRNVIRSQYLKYIGHVCRCPNTMMTEKMLFAKLKRPHKRNPWIDIPRGWTSLLNKRNPGFDSRTRRHMWVEFVGSRPCSEGFSPGSPVFLPPQKPTFLNSNSIRNSRATGLSV